VCTVVCWLEDGGGEATAAVGDWETTGCCPLGVCGVCSPGDWSGVASVARPPQLTVASSQAPNLLRPNNLLGNLTDGCVNSYLSLNKAPSRALYTSL